ncbi:MAG: HAMP domain-containing protein [Acidobacteria bacterium]|nr:HAMP domain-containing protein [Acidobacteriota bacterium]
MERISWREAWARRGLRARIVLLVGLGTLVPLGILGWVSWASLGQLREQVLTERRLLAESIAAHVEYALQSNLETLQEVSSKLGVNFENLNPAAGQGAVKEAYLRSRFLERVSLLAVDGQVLSEEPVGGRRSMADLSSLPFAEEALQSGRPTVSELVVDSGGSRRLYALVPMRNWQGKVVGGVAGEMDPANPRFGSLLRPFAVGQSGSIDLVDSRAVVIASTNPARLFTKSDHRQFLEGLIRQRKTATGTCHSCHGDPPPDGQVREVMAFVPLSLAPWGILIRQPEAETFSAMLLLRREILWFGPMLLAIAVLFAWGAARSVTKPLGMLTEASERITAGEMAKPISALGEDEVGRLGRSLEKMRVALKESLESVARANQGLERRVEERTQELERLYHQLREREELRGQLLRKVISAQEEERKRIARELHDETSQALTALAMRLDTTLAALPAEDSQRRLEEAKALAMRTVDGLHRLILDLRPSVLDDLGLLSAIRWCAERHLQPLGIAVRCEFSGLDRRLPAEVETALFRAVQEAISNVARHAEAETVLIQCALRESILTVEIEDDGKGFDPASIQRPVGTARGMGLLGIRERMELLGGTAQIEAAPGQGCRIVLTVPVIGEPSDA